MAAFSGSTGAFAYPSVAIASVMLWATVNAVTVFSSIQGSFTISSRAGACQAVTCRGTSFHARSFAELSAASTRCYRTVVSRGVLYCISSWARWSLKKGAGR